MRPVGKQQCETDRQAHVGRAQLGLDRAVLEFDHRVDDRLRVEQHRNPVRRGSEQPVSLDHFESLVDERRRVDRDLRAHVPLGMAQGLLYGDVRQLLGPEVAECAAAARHDQPPHRGAFAHEALEDRRMLRVDRNHRCFPLPRQRHHVGAAHYERLLVRQREFLARFDGRHRGREPGVTHQGVHHHVGSASRCDLRHRVVSGVNLGVGVCECIAQPCVILLVGDHRRVGVEFPCLLRQPFPIAVGREDADFEPVGVFTGYVERLHADRAGRTQYGKSLFHVFIRRRYTPRGPRVSRCSRVRIRRV